MKPTDPKFETNPFPLPLTSMEAFHLATDSEAFANTIFCRMRLKGELDEPTARTAIRHILQRHLLLHKTVTKVDGKRSWELTANRSEDAAEGALRQMLTWQNNFDFASLADDPLGFQLPGVPLNNGAPNVDINTEHGLHTWVFVGQGQTMILAGIHHAAGDGLGGVQLLSDLFQVYDNLCCDRAWDFGLRKLDVSLLKQRGSLDLLTRNYLRHLWKQPIALFGMAKFMLRKFQPFQPRERTIEPDSNFPGIVGRWLDETDSQAVQTFADSENVRVNSVVMAAVFEATQKWLQQQPGNQARWLRMLLPISYRSKSDLRLPATNKTTIVQVDRNSDQMKDPSSFLHYLNREIEIVVGWQFDKIFLMVIGVLARLPGRLKKAAQDGRARGTIVFTNLGEPFRLKKVKRVGFVGQLKWVDFDFVGPIRSQMPVNFTLQRHQQRYRLSLHFDRAVLTQSQADAFLNSIAGELKGMGRDLSEA